MNLDFQSHIPADFNDNSRVWIYQSSRLFFISEALQMEDMLNDFVKSWNSHGDPVKGYANLLPGRHGCSSFLQNHSVCLPSATLR
ncbi:MAG TPA: hypothetical protein PKJ94_07005 [Ferruginibacter sp.]|nr:hypothetical protein [Ferruginibacter sp.]